MEIRNINCPLYIREAADGKPLRSSRTIAGTAIVFNKESMILDESGHRFREIIKPEACTKTWLNTQDIKLNMLHDRELTLARNNRNAPNATLRLQVDGYGVHFEFEAPKCDIGDRCLEMVKRGDYSGCSFEFLPLDYEIEEYGTELKVTHTKFKSLLALTIGMDPAYIQTSVNVRELKKRASAKRIELAEAELLRQEREMDLLLYDKYISEF